MAGKIIVVMVVLCVILIVVDIVILVQTRPPNHKRLHQRPTHNNQLGTSSSAVLDLYQIGYFKTANGNTFVGVEVPLSGAGVGNVYLKEVGTTNFPKLSDTSFALLVPSEGEKEFRSVRPVGFLYHPAHGFMVYGPICQSSAPTAPGCGDLPVPSFDITQNQVGARGNISMVGQYYAPGANEKCVPQGNSICKTQPTSCECSVNSGSWCVVTNTQQDNCDPSDPTKCIDPNNILNCLPMGAMKVDSFPSADANRVGTPDAKASGLVVMATAGLDCNNQTFSEQQLGIYLYRTGGFPFTPVSPATKCVGCTSTKPCNALGACQCKVSDPACTGVVDPLPWTFPTLPPMQPIGMEINGPFIYVWGTDTKNGWVVARIIVSSAKSGSGGIYPDTTLELDKTFFGIPTDAGFIRNTKTNIGGIIIEPSDPHTIGIITIDGDLFENYISGYSGAVYIKPKGYTTIMNGSTSKVVYNGSTISKNNYLVVSGTVSTINIDGVSVPVKEGILESNGSVYLVPTASALYIVNIPVYIMVVKDSKTVEIPIAPSWGSNDSSSTDGTLLMYLPYATYYNPQTKTHIMLGRDETSNLYYQGTPINLANADTSATIGALARNVNVSPDSILSGAKTITNYYNYPITTNEGIFMTGMATKEDGTTQRVLFPLFY